MSHLYAVRWCWLSHRNMFCNRTKAIEILFFSSRLLQRIKVISKWISTSRKSSPVFQGRRFVAEQRQMCVYSLPNATFPCFRCSECWRANTLWWRKPQTLPSSMVAQLLNGSTQRCGGISWFRWHSAGV